MKVPMDAPVRVRSASDWTPGPLAGPIVPPDTLQPLSFQTAGPPILKSNNPEVIQGDGWLMTNSPRAEDRQGSESVLRGTFCIFLFHINKAGSSKFLHLLITNPQSQPVLLSGMGSMLTNRQEPLRRRPGRGLNVRVARHWLHGSHRTRFDAIVLEPGRSLVVDRAGLRNRAMVDGRFQITAEGGVHVSTVVTSRGGSADAVNASCGGPAAGEIFSPGPDRFGREAGICATSVLTGVTAIEVPAPEAHLGLCLNTSNKFDPHLQDHTSPFAMRLGDSSDRTYANYGHAYDLTLLLTNPSAALRKVRLSFATNLVSTVNRPSFAFHAPIQVNDAIQDVYVRPTDPLQVLGTYAIAAGAGQSVRLRYFVPGLISIGQQLIVESIG